MALEDRSGPHAGGADCPETERLAEYVEGSLDTTGREEIERHLVSCADCRAVVAETMAFERAEAGSGTRPARAAVMPFRARRWMAGVVAALAAAAALFVAARVEQSEWVARLFGPPLDRPELQELVGAVAKEPTRLVEGRLTGGFQYARPPSPTRGPGDRDVSPDVLIAFGHIQQLAASNDTPENRAALGVAYLAMGNLDKAVQTLEDAAQEDSKNPRVQSDLAAAYVARAQRFNHAEDLARAASAAETAIHANPRLAEAWFNRALSFELLGPASAAVPIWQEYLRVDSASPWAAEAREHLRRLTESMSGRASRVLRQRDNLAGLADSDLVDLARVRPFAARRLVDELLLDDWARRSEAGDDAGAAWSLETARRLADELWRTRSDAYCRDIVRDVVAEGTGISASVRAFTAAKDHIDHNEPAAAQPLLDQAAASLLDPNSALGLRLAYWRLYVSWYTAPSTTLLEPAARLERRLESRRYYYLAGQAHVLHASALQRLARFGDAVTAYARAIDLFEKAGEIERLGNAHMLLASSLSEQGAFADAWEHERASLALVDDIESFNPRHNVFKGAARLSTRADLPYTALFYQTLLIGEARDRGDKGALFEAVQQRVNVYLRLGWQARAETDLAEAQRVFDTISDPAFQESFRLPMLLMTADTFRRTDPPQAVSAASEAIQRMAVGGSLFLMAKAYLTLGRAHLANGEHHAAVEAWQRGLDALEDQRPSIRDERIKISHLADIWDMYAELIQELTDTGRSDAALDVAERGRARALLDSLRAKERAPVVHAGDVQRLLDPAVAVIDYSVVRNGLDAWVLTSKHCLFKRIDVDTNELARLVTRARQSIDEAAPNHSALRRLYDLLIGPVRDSLPAGGRLVIVPDGPLWSLPFAALVNPTGRCLIEDHELLSTPSLSLLTVGTAVLRANRPSAAPTVLAVGDPDFARSEFARLGPLAQAVQEAADVASAYPGGVTLTQSDATLGRIMDKLPHHDVFHFAGHAVADQDYPARSFLLLAGSGDDAKFSAARIGALDLRHVRLVVLAACETANGPVARGEGGLSLARPFLAAGVPLVLGTAWPVRDADDTVLVDFHRLFARGMAAAAALRQAQIMFMKRSDGLASVSQWAAYQLIGGLEGAANAEVASQVP